MTAPLLLRGSHGGRRVERSLGERAMVVILVPLLLSPSLLHASVAGDSGQGEFRISTHSGNYIDPAISGSTVIWTRDATGDSRIPRGDLYGRDIATGQSFRATTNGAVVGGLGGRQTIPAISGSLVVWVDCRGCRAVNGLPGFDNTAIYGQNLATGREFPVATGVGDNDAPAIDGTTVVWVNHVHGATRIYGKNLVTGRIFPVTAPDETVSSPSISGRLVVWQQDAASGAASDIVGRDLVTGQLFLVASHGGSRDTLTTPIISGKTVIWSDWLANGTVSIRGRNLATGAVLRIVDIPPDRYNPQLGPSKAVSKRIVVWDEARNTVSSGNPHYGIYAKNVAIGRAFLLSQAPDGQQTPAVSGKVVVWQDSRGALIASSGRRLNSDIYGRVLPGH